MGKRRNESELVSIVIPIYNAQKYLEECLASVLKQSYSNLEVICVNDGSTDKSDEILGAVRDNRVICVRQDNKGVSSARNHGLQLAKGEWILLLDADDILSEHAVEYMLGAAIDSQIDMVIPKYVRALSKLESGTGDCIEVLPKFMTLILLDYLQYNSKLPKKFQFPNEWALAYSWGRMFRKSILRHGISFDDRLILGEDVLWNLDLFQVIHRIKLLDKTCYYYRQNQESVTSNFQPRRFVNTKLLAQAIFKRICTDNTQMQAARQFIFGRVIHCYWDYFDHIDIKISKREQKELITIPCVNEAIRKGRMKYCIMPPSRKLKLRIAIIKLLALYIWINQQLR